MNTPYDAIIIGAGPAGSSAAILLARAGWSVALLEATPFPRRKVCGECIAAGNLPLLDALGLGEALRRCAGPELQRVALWCGEKRITAALPARTAGDSPWGRAVGREHLDLLLLEQARATGATVLQPCRALSVRGGSGGALCEVLVAASGVKLELRAPVVIRAHGSWQPPPADGTPWGHERRASDLLGFKASFRDASLDDGLLPVLAFAGGYGGMVVASDGLATLACCIRRDRLAACRSTTGSGAAGRAGETVEALLRGECLGVRDALANASRVGPWLAAGPIRPGVRLRAADADAFLIGNAAGEVHPIIGEGISMALQSAWLLCQELAGSADVLRCDALGEMRRREIRQRYASRWRAHFARRLRIAACFAHAAMRPTVAAALLPLLRRAPALLGVAARVSGKTGSAVVLRTEGRPVVIQESPS
ncbi:MAG TPA: NAD(P)/FAD-dependent oxidoreductase [Steroidobacteraceae bacterium]|jgi:flavin-dependent dehydrogenase|nr:NAD(P)/FAD-dependent oxidoreductase [Steroidobacteraceae bacterium]